MKNYIVGSMLLVAVMAAGTVLAQQEPKQTHKNAEGALKFQVAEEALKAHSFVLETYDPTSTSSSRICYNFLQMDGDKVFTQGVWGSSTGTGGGFNQSEGTVTQFTMEPDKKGNIKVYIEANMVNKEASSKGTWPLRLHFKLFKNTNSAPVPGGKEGYIVLPSQTKAVRLTGSMAPNIPKGFM